MKCAKCDKEFDSLDCEYLCEACAIEVEEWRDRQMEEWRDQKTKEWINQQYDRLSGREPSGMDMCHGGCGEAVMFCSCSEIRARRARRLEDQDD